MRIYGKIAREFFEYNSSLKRFLDFARKDILMNISSEDKSIYFASGAGGWGAFLVGGGEFFLFSSLFFFISASLASNF